MAKKPASKKVAAVVTVNDVLSLITETCKKTGTYREYHNAFKAGMSDSELAKNDGNNIAHWLLTPSRIALVAKGSTVSAKNLTIACEALAGNKLELHRIQQAIVKFYESEGVKVTFDRKGYHTLVEHLLKPSNKAGKAKDTGKGTSDEKPAETPAAPIEATA